MEAVHAAISHEMEERGHRVYALGTWRRHEDFTKSAAMIMAYIAQWVRPKTRAEETVALRRMIAMLLMRLVNEDRELSQANVVWSLARLPSIIESELPGYRASGMLRKLVTE